MCFLKMNRNYFSANKPKHKARPSRLGTDGLEDLAGLHEVLNVLAQHAVLGLQSDIFFFNFVNAVGQIIQSVLKLKDLSE